MNLRVILEEWPIAEVFNTVLWTVLGGRDEADPLQRIWINCTIFEDHIQVGDHMGCSEECMAKASFTFLKYFFYGQKASSSFWQTFITLSLHLSVLSFGKPVSPLPPHHKIVWLFRTESKLSSFAVFGASSFVNPPQMMAEQPDKFRLVCRSFWLQLRAVLWFLIYLFVYFSQTFFEHTLKNAFQPHGKEGVVFLKVLMPHHTVKKQKRCPIT